MDTEKVKYNKVKKAPKEQIDIPADGVTTAEITGEEIAQTPVVEETAWVNGTVVKCTNLNFRIAPLAAAKVIGLIPVGAKIRIAEKEESGFFKARFNGLEGYVKTDFIEVGAK